MHASRPIVSLIFTLAATVLGAQTFVLQPSQTATVTESHTVALANGSKLTIKNTNGHIKVQTWDRAEVAFTGQFKPSSKDEQVKVVFESSPKGLEIRGEYPKHQSGWGSYRGAVCEMELKVPRNVLARIDNVNGRITLTGLEAKADCRTVNGAVEAERLSQGLTAETVNGAITLNQVRGPITASTTNGAISGKGLDGMGQGIELSTVNGALSVTMAKLEGSLKATTVNGQVSVDTKGAEHVSATKHQVEATFPGSKQIIHLSTVNGALVVK
ncbi:MAG: hypothetical protein IPP78_16140 [Holophagaceae bacterium]|nr:hypothetical protein [Holophagaceae bacterium]